jgi:acetylornithine deacetylase/succinyl-diaminopimelate desuccinylase-like protein
MSNDLLDSYLLEHRTAHLEALRELLRIPSVSAKTEHRQDTARCADHVAAALASAGVTTEVIATPGHPVVYGEWLGAPGAPTVLVYGHYDVQPVEPLHEWRNPPFEPTIEGGNIVARGATDDKGQMLCHVLAAQAHMAVHGRLPINVKYLIEGEEEVGSPNLDPFLREHRDRLKADLVIISDTSMWAPGRPAITCGLRGLCYVEVHVRGPSHDLHSGLYGGGVANPINALAKIIAGLHDADGRVAVKGFYDNVQPLSDEERAEFASLGHDEAGFRAEVNVASSPGEAGYTVLERITARPTLDCNGIWGGYTGEGAKTVLPATAHAKISCRLVANQTCEEIEAKLRAHIMANLPAGVTATVELHHGAPAFLVDRNAPAMKAAKAALAKVWGVEAVMIRSGGSIPVVASFKQELGIDSVLMGFGLADDRAHSPNEKFGLDNFYNGIRASARVLEELGRA